jgi:hypothetical protein
MTKLTNLKLISVSAVLCCSLLAIGGVPSSATAGKVIFVRSKPHVNAGPAPEIAAAPRTIVAK